MRRLGGSCHDDSELSCMVFGADSRSLRCLGRWGEISQWQERVTAEGDQWQKTDSFHPCREFVTQAMLSPDGRYMAALLGVERASEGEVRIFHETAPDVWQQEGRWPCRSRPGARRRYDETPLHSPLLFSSQARHLFFADGRGLRAFCRNHDSWQELRLESDRSPDGGPADGRWDHYSLAVDAGEHRLAAAQVREEDIKDEMAETWHDVAYLRVHQLLQVWHFEEGHGWRHVARSRNMDGDSLRGSFAMTFSPDGQQLAFKESVGLARRLCILSAMAPGNEPLAIRLRPGAPDIQASNDSYSPDFLQFSTTGRQLATCAFNGVQIWQKAEGSPNWSSVLWQSRVGYGACGLALSPDAFHCALSAGDGKVSVWGFGSDRCLKKVEWQENKVVDALRFTPDGASLAVASRGPMTPCDDFTAARLRCLRLVPDLAGQPDAPVWGTSSLLPDLSCFDSLLDEFDKLESSEARTAEDAA